MAVFLLNTCKFNGCGLNFSTLQELIYHIEDTHLDSEPRNLEEMEFKQTACLPVSYIFRLSNLNGSGGSGGGGGGGGDYKSSSSSIQNALTVNGGATNGVSTTAASAAAAAGRPVTIRKKSNGSEMDEENYESESEKSSIDSWSNNSIESDTNSLPKLMNPLPVPKSEEEEKPYQCTFGNCTKRYRNQNGLKYHLRSVHTNPQPKKDGVVKVYKCHCDKVYKTNFGLKQHWKTCTTAANFPLPFNIDDHTFTASTLVITGNKGNLVATPITSVASETTTTNPTTINIIQNNNLTNVTNTIQHMDTNNIKLNDELCASGITQVAEQVIIDSGIIDTTHSYSMLSSSNMIKKEPNTITTTTTNNNNNNNTTSNIVNTFQPHLIEHNTAVVQA